MPTYDFSCQDKECLGYRDDERLTLEEHSQLLSGESYMECPVCKKHMEQVMGNFTFHLKGDGWPSKDMDKLNNKLIQRNKRLAEKPKEYQDFVKMACEASGKGLKKATGGPSL